MWLNQIIKFMSKVLSPLSKIIGRISSVFIMLMMFLTVADVIGRRFFSLPIIGGVELNELMLVIVVFGFIGFCQMQKHHISIDMFLKRFTLRTQNVINSINYLIFLFFCVFLSWSLLCYGVNQIGGTVTTALGLEIYPIIIFAGVGVLILSIVVLQHLLEYIVAAIYGE